jgi:hypothetical protein
MTNVTHKFLSMYLFLFLTLYTFKGRQIVSIQPLVAVGGRVVCRLGVHSQPAHDTATDTEWQLPDIVLTQFLSPDDEHDVLETCRQLKIKINTYKGICASRWSFTKNHNNFKDSQLQSYFIHTS